MTEIIINDKIVNTDIHIVKEELFDPDIMEAILNDTQSFSKSNLLKLNTYKRGRKHGNCVEVVYHYGKGCEQNQLGRLYVKNNKGLQAFPFDIRNPLLEKYYWDIDGENMHYNLMLKLANEWNINVDNIKYYCDNRDICLSKLSSDRQIAKTAFLKTAYGGNIKLHNEYYNDDNLEPDGDITLLKNIQKEIKNLMNMCYVTYPQYHKLVKKKDNPLSSLFALILQTEERKCILALDEYFKSINRQVDILIHDGVEVRKLPDEIKFSEEQLKQGEQAIFNSTGHHIKLVCKPFKHNFKFNNDPLIIIDDIYAAKKFIELMGNNIVRDKNDIYYFNELNGLWENTDSAFRVAVNKHKNNLIFFDKINGKNINYGGIEKNVQNMKKWILSLLNDDEFISKNADTSIGKLLFTDGYYDFYSGNFIEGFNPKIVFFKRINRPFPKERDEKLIKFVSDTLFVNAFDENDGLDAGLFLKKNLCIALIGDYFRKKFIFATGEANCGKGVLVNAFRNAFDGYIDEYDANNLLYNPLNSQDEAKKLSWVKDLLGVRIAFSNECRISDNKGIDGNLLKTLSSGSDIMKIRGNYEAQYTFIIRTMLFMLANDCPKITPIDTGVCERAKFIRYKLRFVNNPINDDERLADPTIKLKFLSDDYKNALLFVMIDTFNSMSEDERKIGGYIYEPKCVIQETKEWIKDEKSVFLEKLNEKFEITNNPNDFVESKKIIEYLIDTCKLNMSATKIGIILSKLINVQPKDKNINKKHCRLGIKLNSNNLDFDI
jgi:phage/plasmid-associated DNA primase